MVLHARIADHQTVERACDREDMLHRVAPLEHVGFGHDFTARHTRVRGEKATDLLGRIGDAAVENEHVRAVMCRNHHRFAETDTAQAIVKGRQSRFTHEQAIAHHHG